MEMILPAEPNWRLNCSFHLHRPYKLNNSIYVGFRRWQDGKEEERGERNLQMTSLNSSLTNASKNGFPLLGFWL